MVDKSFKEVQNKYIKDFQECKMIPGPTWVTPELATQFAAKNTDNYRNKKRYNIERLTKEMINGKWEINGEAIIFDTNGLMLDGAHRIKIILKTGFSVGCLIVYNVDPKSKYTIDTGSPRTVTDAMVNIKKSYPKLLTTCLGFIDKYFNGKKFNSHESLSPDIALDILEMCPEICDSARKFHKTQPVATSSVLAFTHYILNLESSADSSSIETFFDKLTIGDSLLKDEPLIILRNHLLDLKKKSAGTKGQDTKSLISMILKTWNWYRLPKTKKKFTINFLIKGYEIPKIL